MQAPASAQVQLLALQGIDSEIARLKHQLASLPELAQLAQARKEYQRLAQELVAAQTRVSDLELAEQKAEADVVPVRDRLARNERQVADGSITDPKALTAMIDEIAHLKKRLTELEDAELEVMEELEAARGLEQTVAAEKSNLEGRGRALTASRDEKAAGLTDHIAQQEAARLALVPELPADLLALYDRIRAKAGGVGAALLQRGRCSGCQLQVTASDLGSYRAAPPTEVLRCAECDRILVRTAESGL